MTTTETTSLQEEIKTAATELGDSMSEALPWRKPGWFRRTSRTFFSEAIILSGQLDANQRLVESSPNVHTRAWLVRNHAKEADYSTISLLADVVEFHDEEYIIPYQRSRMLATYNKNQYGLKLSERLGAPQEATLEWIHELGGWVTQIAEANLRAN